MAGGRGSDVVAKAAERVHHLRLVALPPTEAVPVPKMEGSAQCGHEMSIGYCCRARWWPCHWAPVARQLLRECHWFVIALPPTDAYRRHSRVGPGRTGPGIERGTISLLLLLLVGAQLATGAMCHHYMGH